MERRILVPVIQLKPLYPRAIQQSGRDWAQLELWVAYYTTGAVVSRFLK